MSQDRPGLHVGPAAVFARPLDPRAGNEFEFVGHATEVSIGPFLPPQGGNVVLLTQLHWPTVHPSAQEDRPK